MDTQTATPVDASTMIVAQAVNEFLTQNRRVDAYLAKHADDTYYTPVAPTRNRPVYLLGHLTAVSDAMRKLLGMGELLFPELAQQFLAEADNAEATYPSWAELKQKWAAVNASLEPFIQSLTPEQWLERHTSVSPEDFALNPKRNRLSILLSRATHEAYHLGQMNLVRA